MYVKKINYFVFIIHQVNKNGVSGRWFTETDVKHFNSGAQRTITNIARGIPSMGNEKKWIPSQGYFKGFVYTLQNSFLKCEIFHRYFSRVLLIDSELPTLKMDFFEGTFQKFCWRCYVRYWMTSNLVKSLKVILESKL